MPSYPALALSRYDVSFSQGAAKVEDVTTPRPFDTRYRPAQFNPFTFEEALGGEGWLKALALDMYAASRRRGEPEALQEALLSYLEAL